MEKKFTAAEAAKRELRQAIKNDLLIGPPGGMEQAVEMFRSVLDKGLTGLYLNLQNVAMAKGDDQLLMVANTLQVHVQSIVDWYVDREVEMRGRPAFLRPQAGEPRETDLLRTTEELLSLAEGPRRADETPKEYLERQIKIDRAKQALAEARDEGHPQWRV